MKTRIFIVGLLLLAGCQTVTPKQTFIKGDALAYYDFNSPGSYEEGSYAEGAAQLEVRDGRYNISVSEGDSELWYGQWGESFRDVVIDVEARQLTEDTNTVYGVMCRARGTVGQPPSVDPELQTLAAEPTGSNEVLASADATAEATSEATVEATAEGTAEATSEATAEATQEATVEAVNTVVPEATAADTDSSSLKVNNGDGYLFLIEGSGRFSIQRSLGRSVTPLVDWTSSTVIKTGAALNQIRAVCLGNYLALYINGEFIADATDDSYTDAGQVGMVAAGAGPLGVQVQFDNLSISEAKSS